MWKFLEKRPFFRADMAGLGICCTGGYGRIGVMNYELLTKHCRSLANNYGPSAKDNLPTVPSMLESAYLALELVPSSTDTAHVRPKEI